jgi:signal transduction histidine kinase
MTGLLFMCGEPSDETATIATREPVAVDQILPDSHRVPVALQLQRDALIARLDRVRSISHNLGYGVGDDMDSLLIDYTGT